MKHTLLKSGLLAAAFGAFSGLNAGEIAAPVVTDAAVAPAPESLCDSIWSIAKLYSNKESEFFNEFALQGRLHLQYADGESNQGDFDSHDRGDDNTWGPWEVRRWRLGFKSKWLGGKLSIDGQINVRPDINVAGETPFYGNLYDFFATYKVSDDLKISAGKTKAKFFSNEYYTSSNRILTFERSLLVNSVVPGEHTGVWVEGSVDAFSWAVAVYAADNSPEFTRFDAGVFSQVRIGYDLSESIGWDMAQINFDWQQTWEDDNDPDQNANVARFSSAFSLNSEWEKGKFGLITDIIYGVGDNDSARNSDVFGFTIIPSYYITPQLQAVLRYQFAMGDGAESLRLSNRYERNATDLTAGGRGDQYQSAYAGLNYYICDHKLKLMAGVEWSHMDQPAANDDFDGWTWLIGMRLHF
jgi:phosphate-selective porin OprO and OprP